MGALPAAAKVVRFDFRQTFGSNTRIQDRIFLQYSGAMVIADLLTVLTTVRNAWNTNLAPLLHTSHVLTSVTGTDLSSNVAPQGVNSTTSTGTLAGTALPDGTALIIKFKINKRYRGGHPRFYMSGQQVGSLATPNTWSGTVITNFAAGFTNFIAACTNAPPAGVGTLTHVAVQYFSGFTVSAPPGKRAHNIPTPLGTPVPYTVQSYVVNPTVASQRRRNLQSA